MSISAISTFSAIQTTGAIQITQSANDSTQKSASSSTKETSSSSSSVVYDKMDLNEDGTVTGAEEKQYDLMHSSSTSSTNESDKQNINTYA